MKFSFTARWVPLALLVLVIFSFGLMIPLLGFYWDDWPVILTGRLRGAAGFWQFYQYDRPISAWTYVLTFPLLGSRPLPWHIFTLLLRWGTAVAMWWTFIQVWPVHKREVTWAALLFAVYPVFTQQAISVAYSQHWICYLLYFLSLGTMVKAARQQGSRWFWPLTLIAGGAALLQLLTMEYFAGLELLRPVLLWLLVSKTHKGMRLRLVEVLRGWAPYLLVLVGFALWREFFLRFPGEEQNAPVLLYKLLSTPASALLRLLQITIQDTLQLLVASWTNILAPTSINLDDRFMVRSWGVTLLVGILVSVFLLRFRTPEGETSTVDPGWPVQALVVGGLALLLGMLPVWITDRQILVGAYSNRFGLAAMPGASLILVAGIEWLLRKQSQRIFLVAVLVGMAAGMHMRVSNDYRWSWVSQTRFYWQLSWRAPLLLPDTSVVSDGEIFPYVGLYSTSAGLNLIYPPTGSAPELPYWFYSLGRDFAYSMPEFKEGMPLSAQFRDYKFTGNSKNSVLVLSDTQTHGCLHILTPQDSGTPDLPAISAGAVANSNLERIQPGPAPAGFPPTDIFGPEPAHDWCYFYEKADLARQMKDWAAIVKIGDQVSSMGYSPTASGSNTSSEWLPFIEAYARVGNWKRAGDLSIAALERDKRIDASMCALWGQLAVADPSSPERNQAVDAVRSKARCP